MLMAEGLVKRYGGRRALDGFDLDVLPGEIVGLIGHNGAGKSTFVEVVTGLVRPDAGRVSVGGIDVLRDRRGARALTGVAPQELSLYVSATVRDNLRLFAAMAGLRRSALRLAVDQVAEELQLTDVLERRVGVLSGGQRRRTQAAAALVGAAPLLLLDEPTAGAGCLPGSIASRTQTVDGELRITSADPPADLAALLTAGCSPVSIDVRRPDLDDLYAALALEASHAV